MIPISVSEFLSDRNDPRNNNASPANSYPSDGPTGVSIDSEAMLLTGDRAEFEQLQRDEQQQQQAQCFRFAVGFSLTSVLLFVVIDALGDRKVEATLFAFLKWVEEYPVEGVLAVIVVYIFATILFVPGSILTLGTGFAFGSACENKAVGVMLASTAVFIGASLGSICSFLLGRYLFRDCVLRLASRYPIFRAVDRALQANGLKIMILLRLSPLIPYNALDYMSGVTAIPLWSYTVALIGILPGTIMFCFIGASASSLTDSTTSSSDSKAVKVITIVFGVTFAVIGVYVASYYSKLELDRILAADEIQEAGLGRSASQPLRDGNSVYGVLEGMTDGEDHGTGSELHHMIQLSGRGSIS